MINEEFPEIAFEMWEDAIEGEILHMSDERALEEYKPGDMVLCRVNAPLVAPVFELIRRGVKATIRGRDIGKGLITLIKKMKTRDIVTLIVKLEEYKDKEITKLTATNKNQQATTLSDKVDTIIALSEGVYSVSELEHRIEKVFSDKVEGVVFSTCHRAKGLEAKAVYILKPELMPHPSAKKEWEREQERNIQYVAETRTLNRLVYVHG
jgi:superfamily I DNA/RNA helicase